MDAITEADTKDSALSEELGKHNFDASCTVLLFSDLRQ